MKIGIYQHGAVTDPEVAEAISALGVPVAYRNAIYFNERETEKFDRVVVDVEDGQNTQRIRDAYEADGVEVLTLAEFLSGKTAAPAALATEKAPAAQKAAKEPKAGFNPDAPRGGKKPGKKQGEAAPAAPAPVEKKDE